MLTKIAGYIVQVIIMLKIHYIKINYNKNMLDLKIFLFFSGSLWYGFRQIYEKDNTLFRICM